MKYIGKEMSRVDGVLKVTGKAKYAAEFVVDNMAYGFLVMSRIAKGKITSIDTIDAEKQSGVISILTHLNAPKLKYSDPKDKDGIAPAAGQPLRLLTDEKIYFSNQPVALVVAETYEQARFASRLVKVSYAEEKSATTIEQTRAKVYAAKTGDPPQFSMPRGNPDLAFEESKIKFEAEYSIPINHHNPIETHSTTAFWEDGKLTVFDKSQWVQNVQNNLASIFGIPEKDVTVISPFVGGAFGSGLRPNQHPTLAAMAAQVIKRPVKLVLTRQQMFTAHGYRPEIWQKVKLGADDKGKLNALIHEIVTNTSFYEDYTEDGVPAVRMIYACPNLALNYKVTKTDLATPQAMRAPGSVSKMFAIESALDELAYKLDIDPLEIRLVNYAETDPDTGKPWSSKELRECYRLAAEKFGWQNRKKQPRSMRDGRWLVGWGVATGTWGAFQMPASVRIKLNADGTATVQSATSDIGPGTYTVITMIAAEYLGIAPEMVKFELGHTDFPSSPAQGGSWTTASIGAATVGASRAVLAKLIEVANKDVNSPFRNISIEQLNFDNGRVALKSDSQKSMSYGQILKRADVPEIVVTYDAKPSPEREKYAIAAHGAQFVEVKVDEDLGTVRVTRVVEATACGKIMNPKTSHSQEMGGVVWGIGMALTEATEIDHRYGRIMNPNLANYHVPVNADVYEIETIFVEEEDKIVNELGVKGMGELGMVGIPAAIANAIYHATGKRIRSLPITPDKLLL